MQGVVLILGSRCKLQFANYVTTDGVALCVHFTATRTTREQALADADTKWGKRLKKLESQRSCRRGEDAAQGPFSELSEGTRVVAFDPGCVPLPSTSKLSYT